MQAPRHAPSLGWTHRIVPELLRQAWPIAIGMVSYSTMTLVGTLFVARLGEDALAGVGLGGTLAFAVQFFGFGTVRAVKTILSQAMGAGRPERVAPALGAALLVSLALGVGATLVGLAVAAALPAVVDSGGAAAATYLAVRVLAAPVATLQHALREALHGLGATRGAMVATVFANVVNVGADALFLFGLGWGVAGAAWGAVLAQLVEAGVLVGVVLAAGLPGQRGGREGRAALWRGLRAFTRAEVRELVALGLPTGVQFVLEVGSFAVLALLLALMGSTQMAAHQIALQVVHFAFLPAVAVGEAASVLAGNAVGAGRLDLVPRVARRAAAVTSVYTGAMTVAAAGLAPLLVAAFRAPPQVAEVAVRLLRVAAGFMVVDGAHIVARCVLRGTGDVRVPAIVGVVTTWAMTPPLTWLLGMRFGLGAVGGWTGLLADTLLGAGILWWRLGRGAWRDAVPAAARRAAAGAPAEPPPADAAPGPRRGPDAARHGESPSRPEALGDEAA
jgi:MATE family multidrug resistance protein